MTVTLKSKGALVEIDTFGAEVQSYKDVLGIEYLWQGDSAYWHGRAPMLFPMVGGLRDGKAIIDGREVSMKRHGFARVSEFTVVMNTDSMAVFSLKPNEEISRLYPYDFEFRITYRLSDATLTKELYVVNHGEKAMPFTWGGHTAYNVPLLRDEKFEDYVVEFEYNEVANCPTIDEKSGLIDVGNRLPLLSNEKVIPLKHSLFYHDALVFDELKSRKVKLYSRLSGKGVEVDFEGFPYFGIWSAANDAPFVCLEPWTGCGTCTDEGDIFEQKRGMRLLSKDESYASKFSVSIL